LPRVISYIPYGEIFVEQQSGGWQSPYLFNSKELDSETGLYYYGARYLDPSEAMWLSVDPLWEKYVGMSPYGYCAGNPVRLVDPDGKACVYDEEGNFMGTDDKGIECDYYVMKKENFTQGMSHDEVLANKILHFSQDVRQKIWDHQGTIPGRPDYDGFVTVDEGVQWAKNHPDALQNPTPDNTLYINTAKLDFGPVSTDMFKNENEVTAVNLFPIKSFGDFIEAGKSRINEKRYGTVYALGRCNLILLSREDKTVAVVNDEATDYDWNGGGAGHRNSFIQWERNRKGLDDRHGFKVYYYGIGKLNK
ncbi:MAG: RHS repeat-associated core domain-containing protein, partial [Paludibacteraceae bacterium]|nr:RHS repeat-associated core domain-containing protein [Paludibacteraceae bacterium]